MADEPQYSSDTTPNKRKYDDQATPPSSAARRPTGFSSGPPMPASDSAAPPSYNSVPPPVDDFQAAKRRAEQIAARLLNSAPADVKRPRVENGSGAFDSADKGFSPPPSGIHIFFTLNLLLCFISSNILFVDCCEALALEYQFGFRFP